MIYLVVSPDRLRVTEVECDSPDDALAHFLTAEQITDAEPQSWSVYEVKAWHHLRAHVEQTSSVAGRKRTHTSELVIDHEKVRDYDDAKVPA